MVKSIFGELLDRYMPKFDLLYKTYNEKKEKAGYLFRTMLRKKYSVTQTWESADIKNSVVSADIVSLDSSLPLKKRARISFVTGELPKVGMKLKMKESELNRLQILKAMNTNTNEIMREIFNDAMRCADGVEESIERMFLEALSNEGVLAIADGTNTGKAIRVDFGFNQDNIFGAEVKWADENAKPISDLKRVIDAASSKGDIITNIMLAKETYDKMRYSNEGRELFASFSGMPVMPNQVLAVPTSKNFNEAIKDELGIEFIVVDRVVRAEVNGVEKNLKPWNKDKVVFLTDKMVGELVYGKLVEEDNQNKAVNYSKVNDYTLVKKWHTEDPFEEWTSSQAIVMPVLGNVGSIYSLDITESQVVASGETEGDSTVTIWGASRNKAAVIAALNAMGKSTSDTISDASLIAKINKLSNEEEAALKAALGVA